MGALQARPASMADNISLPSLLEFQSPTGALSHVPVRGPARSVIWVVCTMIVALLVVSGLLPVDKVVSAQGRVVSKSPTVVVQPLETAIVRSIDVREGQVVHKGDLLARLDPTFATADGAAVQAQADSLAAEVERLAAEAAGVQYRPVRPDKDTALQAATFAQRASERQFRLENYAQKIAGLESTVGRLQQDVTSYASRVQLSRTVEQKRRELEKLEVGSQLNTLSAVDTRLEAERSLASTARQLQSARSDLDGMRAERDAYDQNWRSTVSKDLTDASRKLSDARENLTKATLRRQLVELRADQDAIVLTVARVSVGSVLQSGDQFLTLVPMDAPLEVEVNVPGSEAGFVHAGEPVTIKFDTFPYVQYGTAQGSVRLMSADSFTGNPDAGQRGAQQQQQSQQPTPSFYRARISIDHNGLHDLPANFSIVPGMPVTADVKTGERTVLTYLLNRALPVWMDGMREP